MDIATIVGLVLGVGLILASIAMGGGGLGPFINIPSLMITVGGAFSALLINFPMGSILGVFAVVMKCFLVSLPSPKEVSEQFKEFGAVAKKNGLMALEEQLGSVKYDFMKRGMEMVVGGMGKDDVVSVMETEIGYAEERHKVGKKILDALGAGAPAFGMIGTLIGLIQMLRTLDDPSQIGGGMATALLTTLYGAVMANLFCIPLAGKLEARSKEEVLIRELIVVGLVAIAESQSPSAIQDRLAAFLAPKERNAAQAA